MITGSEHAITQRATVLCPAGHRLGRVESSIVPQVRARARSAIDDQPNRLELQGSRLIFECAACRQAGAFDFRGSVRRDDVVELLAAIYVYGPAHCRVRLTRQALREKVRATIGRDHEEPGQRDRRRQYFAARTNTR